MPTRTARRWPEGQARRPALALLGDGPGHQDAPSTWTGCPARSPGRARAPRPGAGRPPGSDPGRGALPLPETHHPNGSSGAGSRWCPRMPRGRTRIWTWWSPWRDRVPRHRHGEADDEGSDGELGRRGGALPSPLHPLRLSRSWCRSPMSWGLWSARTASPTHPSPAPGHSAIVGAQSPSGARRPACGVPEEDGPTG